MLTRRQPEQRASQNLEYGDLRLETDTFQLSCGERSVRLSRKEFDMLELLSGARKWSHQGESDPQAVGV